MEVSKVRSMFLFVIVFASSVSLFICIVVTFQQQHFTALFAHSYTDRSANDTANATAEPPSSVTPRTRAFNATPSREPRSHRDKLTRAQPQPQRTAKRTSGLRFHGALPLSKQNLESASETDEKSATLSFRKAVRENTGSDGIIFLSTVDSAYGAMGLNLYLTSFVPFNITNYLFVGTDRDVCRRLTAEHPVKCFRYFADSAGNLSSIYGSVNFCRKTHYKTKAILETLRLGVTVVIVDLDIVFLKNPIPFLTCAECDIQTQSDGSEGNSGFYMARPTKASIELHEKALILGARNSRMTNQKALRNVINWMMWRKKIRVLTLDEKQFPYGIRFYEDLQIMFAGDVISDICVIVHNNWIVTQDAKIYRFKETGMWMVDTNGYYSDPRRKYLAYENPVDFGRNNTLGHETDALRVALFLGTLLNRTVILPDFYCHGCGYPVCKNTRRRCALNTFYRILHFNQEFLDLYREHVFLRHPKVPASVTENQSVRVLIKNAVTSSESPDDDVMVLTPSDAKLGPSEPELMSWFANGSLSDSSVLRFHSLYGLFPGVESILASKSRDWFQNFSKSLSNAFKKTDYRQY